MMMQKVVASYASVSGIVFLFHHLPPVFVINRDFIAKFEENVSKFDLIFGSASKRWRLAWWWLFVVSRCSDFKKSAFFLPPLLSQRLGLLLEPRNFFLLLLL
jgi:hypothetical protein